MAGKNLSAYDSRALFHRIGAQTTAQEYQDKQVVFAQNDPSDAMFYLQRGTVKLTVDSGNGKKAVIAILQSGAFFGECCLTKDQPRKSTATAINLSGIVRLKTALVTQVIHADPEFAKLFIAHLLFRMSCVEEELVDQIFNSSEKRLARVLLLISGYGLHTHTKRSTVKINQETLAEMVGTTRSRVSFFMNRFRKQGFIDYNGSLEVHPSLLAFLQQK
jgi:CRP-like cAMP-binding protein